MENTEPKPSEDKNKDKPWFKTCFFIVYPGVAKHFKLRPVESLVLFAIRSLQLEKGYSYITQDVLARLLSVTTPTINVSLQKLEKAGLLKRENAPKLRENIHWQTTEVIESKIKSIPQKRKSNNGYR